MEFIALTDARRGGLSHSALPNLTRKRPRWTKAMIANLREQAERHGYELNGCNLFTRNQGWLVPVITDPICVLHYRDAKYFLNSLELAALSDQELEGKAAIAKSFVM